MGLVAARAHAGSHGGVDGLFLELAVALVADGLGKQQSAKTAGMRVVAVGAKPPGHGCVDYRVCECTLVVAPEALLGNGKVEEFFVVGLMRIVADRAEAVGGRLVFDLVLNHGLFMTLPTQSRTIGRQAHRGGGFSLNDGHLVRYVGCVHSRMTDGATHRDRCMQHLAG